MVVANKRKSKSKKILRSGVVHINATFNNTIVTISDVNGDTFAWASGGTGGFKGARKSTPFAAQKAVEKAMNAAIEMGLNNVSAEVKGPGAGRDTALKALGNFPGITVTSIKDVTPLPHNGCRPPKKKRV